MKIVCVSGGSYKSFYINHFVKMKKCDLLVFNFNIIYDYVVEDELLKGAIVTKELMMLSKRLKTVVVAGVYCVTNEGRKKSLITCNGDKIEICSIEYGAKIFVSNNCFVVGDRTTKFLQNNKIILSEKDIYANLLNCSKNKIYIFCHSRGVSLIVNKKIKRKFNKCSKFILK